MKISRKGFISAAAAAAATMSLPSVSFAGIGSTSNADLSAALFARRLGETFGATHEGCKVELTLESVREVKSCRRTEQFSLVFRGPADVPLSSGEYRVTHDALRRLHLYLTPGAEPSILRADFNLLRA